MNPVTASVVIAALGTLSICLAAAVAFLALRLHYADIELREHLAGSVPCCGEWDTCKRPCVPRGEHIAKQRMFGPSAISPNEDRK